jgi:hypothetical protein
MEVFDRYLAEEAALRLPDVDLQVRARFHRVVRQSALAWKRHPKAGFRILRSRHTLALAFEGPVEGKTLTLFTFRSACEFGDYRFMGFTMASVPQGLSPAVRSNLQRLRELYEAALPQAFHQDDAVAVVIRKLPSIDFLPIVDEARRVLDDGNQDFPPIDMKELMVVPAEHARMFVGKTTVVPVARPRVEPPQAPTPPQHKAEMNGKAPPPPPAPAAKKPPKPATPPPPAKKPAVAAKSPAAPSKSKAPVKAKPAVPSRPTTKPVAKAATPSAKRAAPAKKKR